MKNEIDRKTFLMRIGIGLGGLAAAAVAVPVVSALIAPLLAKKNQVWRKVGGVTDFEINATKLVQFINADPTPYAGVTAQSAAWVRRNSQTEFIAFSANCTHLGCPVRWEAGAQLFMCPCHGGVYYKDGTVAAGPPPKRLTEYKVRIYKDQVQILSAPLPLTNMTA